MGVILWQGLIELWDKHCKERDISDIPQQEVLTCTELVLDEADQLIEHNRLAGENQARITTQSQLVVTFAFVANMLLDVGF